MSRSALMFPGERQRVKLDRVVLLQTLEWQRNAKKKENSGKERKKQQQSKESGEHKKKAGKKRAANQTEEECLSKKDEAHWL